MFSVFWIIFSILISTLWINDFAGVITLPFSIIIILGIAIIPGYINSFFISTFLLSKKPGYWKGKVSNVPITILIACRNEEDNIYETLENISKQEYKGKINIILIDNGSTDNTCPVAREAGNKFKLNLEIISESLKGKYRTLNKGLSKVTTKFVISIDADTILHKSAINNIV